MAARPSAQRQTGEALRMHLDDISLFLLALKLTT